MGLHLTSDLLSGIISTESDKIKKLKDQLTTLKGEYDRCIRFEIFNAVKLVGKSHSASDFHKVTLELCRHSKFEYYAQASGCITAK